MANKNFLNALMNGKVETKSVSNEEPYIDPEEEKFNLDSKNEASVNDSKNSNIETASNNEVIDFNNKESSFDINAPIDLSSENLEIPDPDEEVNLEDNILDLDMNYYTSKFKSVSDLDSCEEAISEFNDTVGEIIAANKSNSNELAEKIQNYISTLEEKKEIYIEKNRIRDEENAKIESEKNDLLAQLGEFSEEIEKADLQILKDIKSKLYNFANKLSNSIIKDKAKDDYNALRSNLEGLSNRLATRTEELNKIEEEKKNKEEEKVEEAPKPRRRGRPPVVRKIKTEESKNNKSENVSNNDLKEKEITVDSEIELQIFNHVCVKVFEDLKENYTGEIYNKSYSDKLFDEFINELNGGTNYYDSELITNPLFIALINEVISSDYTNDYLGKQNTKDLLRFILVF